jgi:hypothetical protein
MSRDLISTLLQEISSWKTFTIRFLVKSSTLRILGKTISVPEGKRSAFLRIAIRDRSAATLAS